MAKTEKEPERERSPILLGCLIVLVLLLAAVLAVPIILSTID